MHKLLLVEDDESLGSTLKDRLEKEGYLISWCRTVASTQSELKKSKFDLSIVDIGLSDGSGLELAKAIKAEYKTALIFVTAMSSAEYRLKGFEIGADDYIPKPFHLKELLLRVTKVLSNRKPIEQIVESGGVTIDFDGMSVTFLDGRVERPLARDFILLELLVQSAPRVISRDEVLKKLFPLLQNDEDLPTERTIDNSILRLRQLLKGGSGDYIRSVRGVGYQWMREVSIKSQ